MKKLWIVPVVVIVWLLGFTGQKDTYADDQRAARLRALLDGFHQVPIPVHTEATGTFRGRITADGTITYTLSYSGLTAPVRILFADVHFGHENNTGGILFFLCSNPEPGEFPDTAPTQANPQPAVVSNFSSTPIGTVTGPVAGQTVPVTASLNINGPVAVPGGTQTCPEPSGTVTGTIGPADVVKALSQGIDAGEFEKVLEALRSGQTYVQIHTAKFRAGEISRQIQVQDN